MAARKGGLSGNSPEQDLNNRHSLNASPPLFDVDPPALVSRDSSRSNGRRPKPSTPPPPLPVEQSEPSFIGVDGKNNNNNGNYNTSFSSSGPATSREDNSESGGVIGSGSLHVAIAVLGTGSAVCEHREKNGRSSIEVFEGLPRRNNT